MGDEIHIHKASDDGHECILCGEETTCEREDCQKCCEHDDLDDAHCLICGLDLSEELGAAACDRWKDHYKYGD